jgi:hypothetical protein
MATLLGVLMLAAPIIALVALAALVDHRRARREVAIARQILLTDTVHARLGGVVAPVVRRCGASWQVAVAVPFERPAVVTGVLASVDELFEREPYEVVLSRQATPVAATRPCHTTPLGKESLSWT